jgi:hypothetical protein
VKARIDSAPLEVNKFKREVQKTKSLMLFERVRHQFPTDLDIYKTMHAAELLQDFEGLRVDFLETVYDDELVRDLGDVVNLLKDPAEIGFACFVRYHASTWTLWDVLLIFESAIFLSAWIKSAERKGVLGQPSCNVLERLEETLSMAMESCIESEGLLDSTNEMELEETVLWYWSRVLVSLVEKPFARLLGEALGLMSRGPSGRSGKGS